MIYLMLYSKRCGHLYAYNYQHHMPRVGMHLCQCYGNRRA
jgi:hypothetical protein